jgi:pyruvate/2-oxoglutarate dehydrogenase complex dihydrolipoamide acyltransferase (E2) component
VTRFVALPNRYQSAILAISGERPVAAIIDGNLAERPTATLTLSYDHQLCDGMYAADFLDTLVSEMENMLD